LNATRGSALINNNGVNLSFGQLGFVSVMQIAFAVSVIFAGIGLGLSKITEHEQCKAYQQKVVKAVIQMGLLGADLINFSFLIVEFLVSILLFSLKETHDCDLRCFRSNYCYFWLLTITIFIFFNIYRTLGSMPTPLSSQVCVF